MSKFIYMLCMKYVEMQAHEVYKMYNKIRIFLQYRQMVLVCNNTHDKLCKTPFANYISPDG
jgi:hypothetical protein